MPPPAATDIVRYRATTAEGRFVLAWKFVQDAPGSSGWRLFGSPPCLRISVSIAPSSWRRTRFTETAPIFQPSKTEAGESSTTAGSPLHFRDPQICPQDTPAIWNVNQLKVDRKSTRLNSSHLGISYA